MNDIYKTRKTLLLRIKDQHNDDAPRDARLRAFGALVSEQVPTLRANIAQLILRSFGARTLFAADATRRVRTVLAIFDSTVSSGLRGFTRWAGILAVRTHGRRGREFPHWALHALSGATGERSFRARIWTRFILGRFGREFRRAELVAGAFVARRGRVQISVKLSGFAWLTRSCT